MQFGCCTTIANYDLLVAHGYDCIILSATELMAMNDEAFDQTRKILTNGHVKCMALNNFCVPQLKLCGTSYDQHAVTAYSRALAERAGQLGVKHIGVGAPQSRSISPDFSAAAAAEQFKRSLTCLCSTCAPYGIEVLLEAVCDIECNFITTTDEAAALVGKLNIPNLNLVFDTYHAFMMHENAAPLRRAMKYVKLIHVAQNIDNRRHYLRRENLGEYRVYFDELLKSGYNGEVSVEAFYDDIEAQLPETLDIMKTLCSQTRE